MPFVKSNPKTILFLLLASFMVNGCTPFMRGYRYGYTNRESLNTYHIVNADEKNFGNKRIRYAQEYYRNTVFDAHVKKYGNPDLVYEYPVSKKYQGIKLFYVKLDSVYVFESKNSIYRINKYICNQFASDLK